MHEGKAMKEKQRNTRNLWTRNEVDRNQTTQRHGNKLYNCERNARNETQEMQRRTKEVQRNTKTFKEIKEMHRSKTHAETCEAMQRNGKESTK